MEEIEAFELFKLVQQEKLKGRKIAEILPPNKWVRYVQLANSLTGSNIIVKKCLRCIISAHAYLSDYFNLKK